MSVVVEGDSSLATVIPSEAKRNEGSPSF
jgi:hypothetical protein